jgi:hypothetical protein
VSADLIGPKMKLCWWWGYLTILYRTARLVLISVQKAGERRALIGGILLLPIVQGSHWLLNHFALLSLVEYYYCQGSHWLLNHFALLSLEEYYYCPLSKALIGY